MSHMVVQLKKAQTKQVETRPDHAIFTKWKTLCRSSGCIVTSLIKVPMSRQLNIENRFSLNSNNFDATELHF